MFRATKAVYQNAPIRPGAARANLNHKPGVESGRGRPRMTPVGFAFILGGLAFASYIFKPSRREPTAALETLKPRVAIIFGSGESSGRFQQAASKLGFQYVDVTKDMGKLDGLIRQGKTRFFVDGFRNSSELQDVSNNVMQPDLILHFGGSNAAEADLPPRVVNLDTGSNYEAIADALEKRNLL